MSENTQPKFEKPCKDLLESFLASEVSFSLPEIQLPGKKKGVMKLSCEYIAVYRYMFYVMYRNRYQPQCGNQEVCNLSYQTIARYARVGHDSVKNAVKYGIIVGILTPISKQERKKGIYAPGHLFDKRYPQFLSTEENLGALRYQIN